MCKDSLLVSIPLLYSKQTTVKRKHLFSFSAKKNSAFGYLHSKVQHSQTVLSFEIGHDALESFTWTTVNALGTAKS